MNARVFSRPRVQPGRSRRMRRHERPTSTEPSFTLKEFAPKVRAAISNSRSSAPAPANTGFVIVDDGVAVIGASMSVDAEDTWELTRRDRPWRRFARSRSCR